jgi:hypothetical protein
VGGNGATLGFRYNLGVEAAGCLGPVDAFVQLDIGNRIAWKGSVTASSQIDIDLPWLFGGDMSQGGISGIVEVRMGEPSQMASQYVQSIIGNPIPANRGLFCLIFRGRNLAEILAAGLYTQWPGVFGRTYPPYVGTGGFYWAAMNPYIKPIAPTVTRILAGWGIPVWYPEKATIVQNRDAAAAPVGEPTFSMGLRTASTAGQLVLNYPITNTDLTPSFSGYVIIDAEWLKVLVVNNVTFQIAVEPAQFGTTAAAHLIGRSMFFFEIDVSPIVAMNPAHMIYQCVFDPAFGLGKPTALANDAVWRASADTLFSEGFGLCMLWSDQATLEDFVNDILKHIDGILDFNLQTGLYELRLIRNDYDPTTLPVFDQTNILSMDNFARSGWGESTNEVIVQYTNQATGLPDTIPVQDLASIFIQIGQVISITQVYVGIQDPMLAIRVGQRDLQVLSTPLAAFTIKTNRSAWNVKRGDPIKVNWPANKLNQIVCRVLDIDNGALEAGTMTLTLVEDVFAMPLVTDVSMAPQTRLWQNPSQPPASIQLMNVLEIPYQVLQSVLDTSSLTGNESYPLIFAQKPAPQNSTFRVNQSDTTAFTVFEQLIEPVSYNSTVALSGPALVLDTTFTFASLSGDSPDLYAGGVALIDNEWIGITSVNLAAGTMVVVRGVLDSIPAPHANAAVIWLFSAGSSFKGFLGTDSISQMSKGTQEFYRATGRSVSGDTAIGSATSVPHTHAATWNNPYPPANVEINGVLFPASISGDFTISWNGRNRLQQTSGLIGWTGASISPEAGVSYTLQVFDATTSALIKEYDGLPCAAAGGSFHFTADLGTTTNLKVVLFAVRGICQSNQFVLTATLDVGGYGLSYDTSYGGATLGIVLAPGINSLPATPVTEVPSPVWINNSWYSFANEVTLKSTDNISWIAEGPASPGTFSPNPYNGSQGEMVFGNNLFAFANGQGYCYRGVGAAWVSVASSAFPTPAFANPIIDCIAFDGAQFIALGSEGSNIWTSPDAQAWTLKGANPNALSAMSTKKIMKVGANYIAFGTVAGVMNVARSTDLVSWTFAAADVRLPLVFSPPSYWSFSSTGLQKSTDCLTWTPVASAVPTNFVFGRWSSTTSELIAYGTVAGAAYSAFAGTTLVKFEAVYDTMYVGEKTNLTDTGTSPPSLFVRVGSPQEYGGKLMFVANHATGVTNPIFPSSAPNGHYYGVADEITLGSVGNSAYDDSGLTNRDTSNSIRSPRRVGNGTKHYLEFTVLAFDPGFPQSSTATFNAQLVSDFSAPSSLVQGRGTTDFTPQIGDIVGYALDLTTAPGTLVVTVNGTTLKTVTGFGVNQAYTFIIQPSSVADKHSELRLNVGQSAFAHAPSGFTAWND